MADLEAVNEPGAGEEPNLAQQHNIDPQDQPEQLQHKPSITADVGHGPTTLVDGSTSNSQGDTEVGPLVPPTQVTPSRSSEDEHSGRKGKLIVATKSKPATLLWCPVIGRNHSNLIDFGIESCNHCKQDLRPPEKRDSTAPLHAVAQKDGAPANDSDSESVSESESEPSSASSEVPDNIFTIKFVDNAGDHFRDKPWHEILDLETERKDVAGQSGPPLRTITVVSTSLSSESRRFLGPAQFEEFASNFLTNPNYTMEVDKRIVVVRSIHIKQALQKIVTYCPGLRLSGEFLEIVEPYCLFYHHLDGIKAYQRTFHGAPDYDEGSRDLTSDTKKPGLKPCDEVTYNHLAVLRDAIQSQNLAAVMEEEKRHEQSPALVTFGMLWLLLKPGTTVYTKIQGRLAACVIKQFKFSPEFTLRKEAVAYKIELWHLQYDGKVLGRHELDRSIRAFEGEKRLTDLEVIPAKFYDAHDNGALRKKLEDRGEKYFKFISRPRQGDYRGQSLGKMAQWHEGRVVLDTPSYYDVEVNSHEPWRTVDILALPLVGAVRDDMESDASHESKRGRNDMPMPPPPPHRGQAVPDARSSSDPHAFQSNHEGPWVAYDYIDPRDTESLDLIDEATGGISRHRYLLCPADLIGFVLKPRKWDILDVECCSDIKFNTAAIESLVLPEERKMIISSLVYRFSDVDAINRSGPAPWTADFVQNKGEGQIFLLHGSPGVGKTLTAECIAESTGRPLLSLTCGDIGTIDNIAENRLSKWFRLAEIWGAVMLLDEADVFLEKRATSDLERNSLVSIFLRTMEYYRGILFLTTNRVGHFDDALVSRVHVVIRYDNLSEKDRGKIWSQFFNKLQAERSKYITISRKARRYVLEDEEVTKVPWNGREIRNAFQTAVAFAEYRFAHAPADQRDEKACLEEEDFAKVCEMTGAFKRYLQSISGQDESGRARSDQARNDNFGARG